MRVGYYYANSKQYGRFWREVKGYTNLYADWELGTKFPILTGKKLWVDFSLDTPAKEQEAYIRVLVKALKPRWGKVLAIQFKDEPNWSQAKVSAIANRIRLVIKQEGLPLVPIGAVFSYKQIMFGTGWRGAIDWVGIEGYITYLPGESGAGAQKRVIRQLQEQLNRIVTADKVIIVGQAYDRNGDWKDLNTLIAIQEPTFNIARTLGDRLLALLLFSYARQGGTRSYPALKAEHRRLLA